MGVGSAAMWCPPDPVGNAVERAYGLIRDNILAGRYQGGEHLRSGELAVAAGVSRTPVREALRRLHSEGLVNFRANYGAFVTGWTVGDLDEVFGLRAVLESYAAELAVDSMTAEQVDRVARWAEDTFCEASGRTAGFLDRFAAANSALHGEIVRAAHRSRLAAMVGAVVEVPLVMRTLSYYGHDDLLRSAGHHRELAAALRARDGRWAGSVMRSHIHAAHAVMREALG